jgi:tetratricopeptide (TPR) repeat protein
VVTAQIDPELALRLSLLEKTMLAQSQGQAAIYSETTRLLMFFGSACVAMGLIAMIAAVFLMNRTLASVSAITAQVAQTHGSLPALPAPGALVPAAGAQPAGFEKIQASGQRFQGRMTSLEQRLEELEHLAGHGSPSAKPADTPAAEEAPADAVTTEESPAPRRVIPVAAILVRKSETLMNLGKLDEAMAALDEAAANDGDPAEIHLARGRVLEKLGRLGDALQSYDLAVSNDQTNTAALLMKAGVLNRQERFDEALTCYERALAMHRAAN